MRSFILKCTICIGLLCSSFLAFSQGAWDECEDSHGINVCFKQNDPSCANPPNGSYVVQVSGIPPTASDVVVILYNFDTKENEKISIPLGVTSYEVTFNNLAYETLYHPLVNIDGIAKWEGMSFQLEKPEYSAKLMKEREAGCNGQPVGIASVEFNAGFGPYTWEWNKKDDASFAKHSNQAQITDMSPGEYFVKVTDAKGCMIHSDTLEVATQPISISVTKVTDVTCKDTTDGAITVDVVGAYGDYNLYWNGDKNHLIDKNALGSNSLPADMYMIMVEDEIGCTDETGPVEVKEPVNKISLILENSQNLVCKDYQNGEVQFSVQDANGAVTYEWSDGTVAGLSRNDLKGDVEYTLTITDTKQCKAKYSIKLSQPKNKVTLANPPDTVWPSCFGYSDGKITVSASGGKSVSGPYTYYWNSVVGDVTNENIPAGDYEIVAQDEFGCADTLNFTLHQPEPLNTVFKINGVESSGSYNLTCNGDDVTLELFVTGGTMPYKYQWGEEPFGNKTKMEDVGAGDYIVTIRDKNGEGCAQSVSQTIEQPEPLIATISELTPIKCNGDSGELQVVVTGGSGDYTYEWSNGSKTDKTGLVKKGTYTVTITDTKGCPPVTGTYELKEPDKLEAVIMVSKEACDDVTQGNLTAQVTGGTLPYNYSWNTGATTETLDNLSYSVYRLSITDDHGCIVQDEVDLSKRKNYHIELTHTKVSCADKNNASTKDGTARVQIFPGEAPYTIVWSTMWSTGEIVELGRGANYISGLDTTSQDKTKEPYNWNHVSVVDKRGCIREQDFDVAVVPPMLVSSLTNEPSACTIPTGKAKIAIDKKTGTRSYSFKWFQGSDVVSTKASAENLIAGDYGVRVTDRNGCILDTSVTIVSEANIKLVVSSEDTVIRCLNGHLGSATAMAINGVEPYQYAWSNGATGETVSNLSAGVYSVTATDADGCDVTKSIEFVEDEVLTIEEIEQDHKNVSCHGLSDGYLAIRVTGGVPPYTISWDNDPLAQYTNQNLRAGTYKVTVTDSKNCQILNKSFIITEPDELQVSVKNVSKITCADHCDASATAVVTGGTQRTDGYYIRWDSGEIGETAEKLCKGANQVYVEDKNNCNSVYNFNVDGRNERLEVYNTTIKSPICSELVPSGEISVLARGAVSGGSYTYEWKNGSDIVSTTTASGSSASANTLNAGAYLLHISDGTCDFDTTITLSHELGATAEFEYLYSACDGDAYKIDISNASVANYTYVWDNGTSSSDNIATGLKEGTHSVVATDKDGCVLTTSFQLAEKHLIAQVNKIDANCFQKANGSATATAISDESKNGQLHYDWYEKNNDVFIGTDVSVTGLAKGDYYVKVYDDKRALCPDIVDFSIDEPDKMKLVLSEVLPSYCLLPNGKVSVEVSGAVLPIKSYEWRIEDENTVIGENNSVCSVVPAEKVISVKVTDNVDCEDTETIQITDVSNFSIEIIQTSDIHCIGEKQATLTVVTKNGYEDFSYEWDGYSSEKTETLTGVASGTYIVTVTDSKGCPATTNYTVNDPEKIQVEFDETPRIECKGGEGILSAYTSGGWAPYTYTWMDANNNVLQSSDKSDLECKKGIYKVEVEDKYGCKNSEAFSYEMTEPNELSVDFTVDVTECGENAETGKITIDNISGGWADVQYRYKWGKLSDDKTWYDYDPYESSELTNLPAGSYTCTISYTENPEDCYIEKKLYTNPLMPESIVAESHHTHCNYYTDEELQSGATDGYIEITKLIVSQGSYDESTRSIADLNDYTFEWSDSKNQTGKIARNLNKGYYEVTVTGKNNCYKTFPTDEIDSYLSLDAEIYATDDNTLIRKEICLEDSLNVSATLQTTPKYDYIPSDESVTYSWSAAEKNCSATVATPDEASTWVTPLTTYYSDSTQVLFSYKVDGCSSKPVSYTILHYDSVNFAIEMYDTLNTYIGNDSVVGMQGARYLFLPVDEPWYVDKTADNGVTSILWRSFKPNKREKGTLSDTTTNEKTYNRSGRTGLLMRLEEPMYLYAVATTVHGCRERTEIFIDVLSSTFVPSGFTPNGDGVNDEWVIPYLNNCPKAKVTVFNRWGVLVYENKIEYATHPWNGTSINGSELPMGAYYYVIEYNDLNNTPTKTGSVSIIR